MKQYKTSTCRARCTLISKEGTSSKVDPNVCSKSSKRRKPKSRDTDSIIESVLNIGSHEQHYLALNNALKYPKLENQAADCVFFRECEKVHSAFTNME